MPFKVVEAQKAFIFQTSEAGIPLAHVTRWGNGVWVMCCPLCGMLHEVLKGQTAGEFEPECIARVTHPTVFAAWQQKHPDAIGKSTVQLVSAAARPAVTLTPKPDIAPAPRKRQRRKAA